MPNRILREGIIDSEAVNSLSEGAEVFYRRLMSVVDDFGRFDGRIAILRGRLYALQFDRVREASLVRWITECETANLVRRYEHNCKPYLLLHKLGEPRAKNSKFPPPPAELEQCLQMHADADMCAQTEANVPYSYSYSDSPTTIDSSSAAKPPRKERKPREPDPLFDAVAEMTGTDPGAAGSHIGKVAAALRGASPPYTPDEVREFARRLWEFCPWAAKDRRMRPELGELQKHIGKLRASRPKQPPPGVKPFDPMEGHDYEVELRKGVKK